ncbi:MAG: DNA mismatch repair protein MutS [Anaerovibrio sp.]|uniref:MutS-related protein n=1 Tax=Anaerovibrio sp. TaxID=1872532 RepID=UPI0025E3918F|nr:DNA mismatch repair protein MutS [Anaerovibrio sp.]MCR5176294.1 DNA mismatch repair protein MutS [Anaerovibrio sp.]
MELSYYKDIAKNLKLSIEGNYKTSRLYTTKRTICFITIVLSVAAAYDFGHNAFWAVSLILLAVFIYLIKRHSDIHRIIAYEENKYKITMEYVSRFEGSWTQFPDNGADFFNRNYTQDTDLNILGPASIFQYCCCARSAEGRATLAKRLKPYPDTPEALRIHQEETLFFLHNPDAALHLQAINCQTPFNFSVKKLLLYLDNPENLTDKLFIISSILPPVSLLLSGAAALGMIPIKLPILLLCLQLAISLIRQQKNTAAIAPLYKINNGLAYYHQLFSALTAVLPKKIGNIDPKELTEAINPIRNLKNIAILAELRHNFILFFFLNTFFMWDFQIIRLFHGWQKHHSNRLKLWLNMWYETETAISLASFGHTGKKAVMPILKESETPYIKAVNLENPLISQETSVPNSIDLVPSLNIITGSNMSGKTTWLRTLATSCILAYAGAPVCADSFELSPLNIMTSIRISDDLNTGTSTFYAEIKRIKAMITEADTDRPMLTVIDEIFKGTNSADRIICAQTALLHLTKPNIITLVSTHDFELCHIEPKNNIPINNYHFEEQIVDDRLLFDYKIKEGPCKTTNAQLLLKLAGIY